MHFRLIPRALASSMVFRRNVAFNPEKSLYGRVITDTDSLRFLNEW
jgi:hypothetical protein